MPARSRSSLLSITDSEDEPCIEEPDVEEPDTDGEPLSLTVAEADQGERLDKLLAGGLDGLSRSRIRALIDQGKTLAEARRQLGYHQLQSRKS